MDGPTSRRVVEASIVGSSETTTGARGSSSMKGVLPRVDDSIFYFLEFQRLGRFALSMALTKIFLFPEELGATSFGAGGADKRASVKAMS